MSRGTTDVLARANRHPTAMVSKQLLRRLDLTTLQLFVAVYEEGTLTRASRREAIAVSAASKRLLELEQALGAAVFVRQATGMSLTPAGETLLHHARRVLVDVERIGRAAVSCGRSPTTSLISAYAPATSRCADCSAPITGTITW